MILLAFLLPLAIYLLILGTINRRRHPLMVYGPWDFALVLFAASGFLLFGGPAVLSVLNEHWRNTLIYGPNSSSLTSATESLWVFGLFLTGLYFTAVVAGSGYFLWRARHQTAIYHIDLETVQTALAGICNRFGLQPLRSGSMYYFGRTVVGRADDLSSKRNEPQQGIQSTVPPRLPGAPNVILEMDAFRPMCHVTLRWEPAQSGLREDIETELRRELAETSSPFDALGGWLTLLATALFLLAFLIGIAVLILRMINRM